jgi:hypothetical protein
MRGNHRVHTLVIHFVNPVKMNCDDRVVALQVCEENLRDAAQLTAVHLDYIFRAFVEQSLDGRHQSEQPSPLLLRGELLDEHQTLLDALNALDEMGALHVLCDLQ